MKYKHVAWVLSFGLLWGGCTNLQDVTTFATSAKALAMSSDQFYEMIYKSDRGLAQFTATAAAPEQLDRTGRPVDKFEAAVGSQALLIESRRHHAAVGALSTYADTLNELATLNDSAQINTSAKELSTSLLLFKGEVTGLNDVNADQLANAIEAVANIFIDIKQQAVIRQKVREAQPHVEAIVHILLADIQHESARRGVVESARKSARRAWFDGVAVEGYDKATGEDKSIRGMLASQIVAAEIDDRCTDLDSKVFMHQLAKAAKSCLEAHATLANEHGSKDAIVKFYNDVKSLVSSIQNIHQK